MKSMTLFYRFIILTFILCACMQSAVLKPSDKKFKIAKITDENKKTRIYYHLKKDQEMVFSNLEDYVENPNANYSMKIITRAKISPNSNSSKTFGIDMSILEDGIERNKILKYKKGSSKAKKSSKSGFNFTQAGFWFDEIRKIKDSEILIKLIDGSPELDIRIVIDEIKYRVSDYTLLPVNREKFHRVSYANSDSTFSTSKGWLYLDGENEIQYKITGPQQIRVFTRKILDDNVPNTYSFIVRENGKYINTYLYNAEKSQNEAHFIDGETPISLSSFNSFFFNIAEGINYYTFKTEDETGMLVKAQSYKDKD